jgi:4-hydroxy-tetrahydrodipicolinate reductase
MNVALVGYGKMGKIIEQVAIERGHNVPVKIDLENLADFNADRFSSIDVAIEFTSPHTAFQNVMKFIDMNVPVVCGTTGWLENLSMVEEAVNHKNGSFLCASNFSVGVNIFFELNKKLAELMTPQQQYEVSIKEIHHTQKKDAPSGTAITLAEQIIAANKSKKKWTNTKSEDQAELYIKSERIDPYPGLHEVTYNSPIDEIQIIHNAHNRNGFALGAVLAGEFIYNNKGIFTMKDVLGFGN